MAPRSGRPLIYAAEKSPPWAKARRSRKETALPGFEVNILVVTETREVVEFVEASPREKWRPSFNVAWTREVSRRPDTASTKRCPLRANGPFTFGNQPLGAAAAFWLLAPDVAVLSLTPPEREEVTRPCLSRGARERVVAGRITEERLHRAIVYAIAGNGSPVHTMN